MKNVKKIKAKRNLKIQTQKGITLLVLVVTIIVLLILAGITIGALTGENGIIKNARESKEQTEIANEKEILEKATVEAMGKNKYGNIEENELQSALNQETGEGKTEAVDIGEEFEVLFKESNRYYTVDKDGNVGEVNEYYKDENPGDITIGENGEKLDGNTEETAYQIGSIEDLVAFSNMVNGEGVRLENGKPVEITTANSFSGKYVNLKANLNFKSRLSYADSERTDFGDINGNANDGNSLMNEMTTGRGFKPIGLWKENTTVTNFAGDFNGQNYKIDNLYIEYSNYENKGTPIGLFGSGNSSNTIISNLEISGEINGQWHTGGIIGGRVKSITNCINRANITGYNMSGGIAGYKVLSIKNCKNYGEINITGMDYGYGGTGGIIGNSGTSGNVTNCENYGEIGKNSVNNKSGISYGGIVGRMGNSSKIDNCKNEGKVIMNSENASTYIGGITGACGYRCYNKL